MDMFSSSCSYCGSRDLQNLYICESDSCARNTARCDSWCSDCKLTLPCGVPGHVSCWDSHIARITVPGLRATHVRYPLRDQLRMAAVFAGEVDAEKQQAQLRDDRAARWLTIDQSTAGQGADGVAAGYGTLFVTDRFEALTTKGYAGGGGGEPGRRSDLDLFPSLVSFIGETGAGKSTLVKGLIQLAPDVQRPEGLETPVTRCASTGSITAPTSEGVNLYSDPTSAASQSPIFFADCEGFGAGAAKGLLSSDSSSTHHQELTILDEIEISADSEIGANCSRSRAVENLYARFLYAFSDVVCFVAKDAQTLAAQMEQLLLWVAGAFKAAVNLQPTKTLIIVFNKLDIYDRRWADEAELAKDTIDQVGNIWANSPTLRRLLEGDDALPAIATTKELLLHYFRSVRVCYFPSNTLAGKRELIGQWTTLRTLISESSAVAGETRKGTWAQYSLEELSYLFSEAWRHFAGANTPFNFYSAAHRDNVSPTDLGGHLMSLLRHMKKKDNLPGLVVDFPRVVAAAFINDCFPLPQGNAIFPPAQRWEETYEPYCAGIEQFYKHHTPCQFTHKGKPCILISRSHDAIHRDSKGKVIGQGPCETGDPDTTIDGMCAAIKAEFLAQCSAVNQISASGAILNPRPSAADVLAHRNAMFHHGLQRRWADIHSYKTCFTCLSSVPDHVLPCGHAFCRGCIRDFGVLAEDTMAQVMVAACVWCATSFCPAQVVQTKPLCAGIRILTLDGGGIRGILELALLKLVEDRIDLGVGIQVFFDLIVGTSTGGIIALGLVIKNLSSTDMIDKFQAIAEQAFYALRTNLRLSTANPLVYGEYVEGMVKKINTAFGSSKSTPTTTPTSATVTTAPVPVPAPTPAPAPASTAKALKAPKTPKPLKAPKPPKTPKSPKPAKSKSPTLFNSLRARVATQFDRIQEEYGPSITMLSTLVATPLLKSQFSLFYGHLDTIRKRSIYPTKPLKVGLREVLGPDTTMFGSAVQTGVQRLTRVAVLSVKNRGRTACAIANYNRRDLARGGDFERSESDEFEFKAWEAGLSTSAAPGYFKSFHKKETSKDYVDGALYHNNPILWSLEEYQKIWEQASGAPVASLDMVVSVGTGYFPDTTEEPSEDGREASSDSLIDSLISMFSRLKGEETWRKFADTTAGYDPKVHYRLNVDIPGGACKLDQFAKMRDLLAAVNNAVTEPGPRENWRYFGKHLRDTVNQIAGLLVAKLFFFHPACDHAALDREPQKLGGHLLCRLQRGEAPLKRLAERIEGFLVVDRGSSPNGRKLPGLLDMQKRVNDGGRLEIEITIETKDPEKLIEIFVVMKTEPLRRVPISGFPRKFYELRSMVRSSTR